MLKIEIDGLVCRVYVDKTQIGVIERLSLDVSNSSFPKLNIKFPTNPDLSLGIKSQISEFKQILERSHGWVKIEE